MSEEEANTDEVLREKLTLQEINSLNERKTELKASNTEYLAQHPEIQTMLNDFMCYVLVEKPGNIFEFAKNHFSGIQPTEIKQGPRYRPLVISGPSGVGKGSIIKKLQKYYPNMFAYSVSHTSRPPRPSEVNGVHYHFTTREAIAQDSGLGKFLEFAEVHGELYGTSLDSVLKTQQGGKICIMDIDTTGREKLKAKEDFNPHTIFVSPPSLEDLEERLVLRGTESQESIQKRLDSAKEEIDYGKAGNYEKHVVNDELDEAIDEFKVIIESWYPHLKMVKK